MEIVIECNIPVYDASYIELSRTYGMPIASNDRDILVNASKYGVKAIDLEEFLEVLEARKQS